MHVHNYTCIPTCRYHEGVATLSYYPTFVSILVSSVADINPSPLLSTLLNRARRSSSDGWRSRRIIPQNWVNVTPPEMNTETKY